MVVAPEFDGMPEVEVDVIRIPAIRHFNQTDFSMALPVPHRLGECVRKFNPDIIHSHHPFLAGGTALRVAHTHGLPLVFTHHTRYEEYTHNVPSDSPLLKAFVRNLATNYANLCDQVFVPSQSMETLIRQRGVTAPVSVVPTGVEFDAFAHGDGAGFREKLGITQNAFVVGHLGRLTEEKNLPFLLQSVVCFMKSPEVNRPVRCLVIGTGPLEGAVRSAFNAAGLTDRLHMAGVVGHAGLTDAYHAMNVFAFASRSETQGLVLTEAMASGVPVVAVDAPGVREVVDRDRNGRLLSTDDETAFAGALQSIAAMNAADYDRLSRGARQTAQEFSMENTARVALKLYSRLLDHDMAHRHREYPAWTNALQLVRSEWKLATSTARSARDAAREAAGNGGGNADEVVEDVIQDEFDEPVVSSEPSVKGESA
jgi:glycosyltransferase involved in cell wall biosynthesis